MALQTNGLIQTRGMVLSLRLYHVNGGRLGSNTKIVNELKKHEVEYRKDSFYEGFSEVESNGKMISALYNIGQPINVKRLKDGQIITETVYSQGQCEYIFHLKENYLECRGASWVAKKGLNPLMDILGVEFEQVRLNETAMVNLCRDAALVKSVQISELDNPALNKIQLSGEILDSAEWTIYRRQGQIRYFRGLIDLPTGGQISAQVSNQGSMLIYRRGDGIPAEDVISAVNMIMKLTKS